MTTRTPSENDLRSLLDEGLTIYKISRKFNTTIPEIFKLGRSYGITLCERCHNNIRGRECQYIVKYEDIVLRDRGIGYHIFQPHTIIESLPCEPPLPLLSDKLFPDYQQEAIPCLG